MSKGKQFISDLKLYSDYLKWDDKKERYETWGEGCDSALNTHKLKYGRKVYNYIKEITPYYHDKSFLVSQRNLQFRGDRILKNNSKLYNCFEAATEFVTSNGVKSFKDYNDGDEVKVLTHKGNWRKAIVRNYGKQKLNRIEIVRNKAKYTYYATENHRWLLKDKSITDNLKAGEQLIRTNRYFEGFDYDLATPMEKLYWCYGMVYGDGTRIKSGDNYKYSMIRLCGYDSIFTSRFEEMGFKTSSNNSLNGDFMAYTGKYLKTSPNPNLDSPELIRAFVAGYLQADGTKNRNFNKRGTYGSKFISLQTSDIEHINFVRNCFPIAGVFICGEKDYTGQETNFGIRGKTISFRLTQGQGKTAPYFSVKNITPTDRYEEVWCLEVEKDNSFTFPNGLHTGNCCVSYTYSPDVFSKGFFVLLSGTGLGVSLKRKFVRQLPKLNQRNKGVKLFVIPDSIEGWAEASKVLISSFCKHSSLYEEYFGYQIKFDYSLIREEGAFITGGFKAPGHSGLQQSLERIEELVNTYLNNNKSKTFKSIIVYDIFMHLSDAVLSGGVRRSAMNIIMDDDDYELINAKTGNWRDDYPWRARSNNSVGLLRGKFNKSDFDRLVKLNEGDSDLGFVFMNHDDDMFNPCISGECLINTPGGLYFPNNLLDNNSVNIDGLTVISKPFRETGIQPILEFKTSAGRKIKVTPNHLMFTDDGLKRADSLNEKDKLIISNNENTDLVIDNTSSSFKKGYLVGSFIGDGNFSKETCEIKFWDNNKIYHNNCVSYLKDLGWINPYGRAHKLLSNNKKINSTLQSKFLYKFIKEKDETVISKKALTLKLMEGNFDYISGILSGYFDADGTVLLDKEKGNSLRIVSNSLTNLETCQVAFNALGIYSKIYNNRNKTSEGMAILPDGKGGKKEYKVKDTHEICITKKSIYNFKKSVKLMNTDKSDKIKKLLNSYTRDFYKTDYVESIVSIVSKNKELVYDCEVQEGVEAFEANGFRVHNCFEIGFNFYSKIKNREESVFQFCNLCEISASACVNSKGEFSADDFYQLCRVAAIAGTLQAGYTEFPYLGKQTEEIVAGEALLGVSITGWMTRPELFDAEILKKGAAIVKKTNKEVAKKIGINPAARSTTVKPSGNASVILKTASGIHAEHSKRYFRIMQLNKESEVAKWLEINKPEMLEESDWSSTGTDYVVYSPCENSDGTIYKNDILGVKHLKLIELVQKFWVEEGKDEDLCYRKTTQHNVSNTVLIDDKEEIVNYIFDKQDNFAAVSFLSQYGDKDYNQAPFTSVLNTQELIDKYGDGVIFMSGLIVDGLHYFNNNLWEATEYLKDSGKPLQGTRAQVLLKKDWLRRARKFNNNYMKKDLDKTIYCMKDVHLWHKWNIISKGFKLIDFTTVLTKPSYIDVNTIGAVACQGGSCEI